MSSRHPVNRPFAAARLALTLALAVSAAAAAAAAPSVLHPVLDAGGGRSASARFILDATLGEPGGAAASADDHLVLRAGFAGQLNEPPLLRPDLFTGRDCHVAIETTGELTRGRTVVDWSRRTPRPANAKVIYAIDADGFFDLLTDRLARLPVAAA